MLERPLLGSGAEAVAFRPRRWARTYALGSRQAAVREQRFTLCHMLYPHV